MRNVEKYNVWYFSWFLWEIEIILMNKWGKYVKTGENFIKMCFTEDYVQNIVLKYLRQNLEYFMIIGIFMGF